MVKKKKTAPKKRSTRRKGGFFKWFFTQSDSIQLTLRVIGLIILIYGAWFNNLNWVILGFVPFIVGYWWSYVNRK